MLLALLALLCGRPDTLWSSLFVSRPDIPRRALLFSAATCAGMGAVSKDSLEDALGAISFVPRESVLSRSNSRRA